MALSTPDLDSVTAALLRIVPRFTLAEQRLALALYQELARGVPVTRERLGTRLRSPTPDVDSLLASEALGCLVFWDDARRIVGFGGLAVVPMHHRLQVGAELLYTWCAWDSPFLPDMVGRECTVTSECPETGELIRLTVDSTGVTSRSHPDAAVSFLLPATPFAGSDTRATMASFCHFVFFFASRAAGTRWISRHPDCFLLSIDDAFELGRRKKAIQFAEAWSNEAQEPDLRGPTAPGRR